MSAQPLKVHQPQPIRTTLMPPGRKRLFTKANNPTLRLVDLDDGSTAVEMFYTPVRKQGQKGRLKNPYWAEIYRLSAAFEIAELSLMWPGPLVYLKITESQRQTIIGRILLKPSNYGTRNHVFLDASFKTGYEEMAECL